MVTESSIELVLKEARGHIGYKEGANNNNIFAGYAAHPNHQPWCATFIVSCFKRAGALAAIKNSASCIEIYKWGKQKKALIDYTEAQRGDLILMDFTGSGIPQHIGIASKDWDGRQIETIEGNTGDASQTNGDGVARKKRQSQYIFAVIRPLWSNS